MRTLRSFDIDWLVHERIANAADSTHKVPAKVTVQRASEKMIKLVAKSRPAIEPGKILSSKVDRPQSVGLKKVQRGKP